MAATSDTPAELVPTVTVSGGGTSFLQRVSTGRHFFLADEPQEVGGTDQGPDPYALLLASLGACTSMTLGMYARKKQWPLETISVQLSHQRVHAEDCATCETKTGFIGHIHTRIELTGSLSDEQRQRLLEMAEKCPVHRTLSAEIHITSELVSTARS
jgi:putative redox protein